MWYFKEFTNSISIVVVTGILFFVVPGCSGCVYFGSTQEMCDAEKVAVSELPKECSSLLFYEIRANSDFEISDGTSISGNEGLLNWKYWFVYNKWIIMFKNNCSNLFSNNCSTIEEVSYN